MIFKEIDKKELKKAIEISFGRDLGLKSQYDPCVKVDTLDDIIKDVSKKIDGYTETNHVGVYEKGKLIGYFVYCKKMLISFALAPAFRLRKYLKEFFQIIKKTVGNEIKCFLWSRNQRAIKWLLKNGFVIDDEMVAPESGYLITKLTFS